MNWRIFLFNARAETDLSFEDLIDSMRSRNSFTLNYFDKNIANLNYAYRQGLSERLGFYEGPTNEVVIERGDKTTIDFRYPKSILVGFGLLTVAILCFGFYMASDIGIVGSLIIILTLYFWGVVRLNSQYYYFKSDLEEIENHLKHIL